MRLRSRLPARVPVDMTPMIDIVFQLLIFFVLTLRIAPAEGDFELKMPRHGLAGAASTAEIPLVVTLDSDANGGLTTVALNGEKLATVVVLHDRVARLVAEHPHLTTAGRAELRCDKQLAYEHMIAALGAVSSKRESDGTLTRLIEQVNLLPR